MQSFTSGQCSVQPSAGNQTFMQPMAVSQFQEATTANWPAQARGPAQVSVSAPVQGFMVANCPTQGQGAVQMPAGNPNQGAPSAA